MTIIQITEAFKLQSLLANGPFLVAVACGLLWLAVIAVKHRTRRKALLVRLMRANELLANIKHSLGLEKNLGYLLEIVGSLMDASVYAFYVFDDKNGQYFLKTVRHSESDFGKVAPSYSGLKAYKKEDYMPQVVLSPSLVPEQAGLVKDGEVPLFLLPIKGKGVIRIGPVREVGRKLRKALIEFGHQIENVLPELVEAEAMRNQVDVVAASAKALQNISNVAVDPKVTLEVMIGASRKAIGAMGGFYLEKKNGVVSYVSGAHIDEADVHQLAGDRGTLHGLFDQFQGGGTSFIQRGSPAFYQLPPYMAAMGIDAISITPVSSRGTLIFLFDGFTDMEDDVRRTILDQLGVIAEDLADLIDSQMPLQHLSKVYVNILKKLAHMMDNLNPYTVGYSDQMSRYAIVIAKQLGLPEDEIRDIALAAYLSNIGVLGLSSDLYQKEGKYTEIEFEMMKLHAEVGASIVSVTTGNQRVASYILYHHERMDGAGYPKGIGGHDIPVGARIIAVVQTFLAKINGRKGRDPLPFNNALQMLKSASGTQLDDKVVNALLDWFQERRGPLSGKTRSLGSCWEMCCTPSSICEHCPVYTRTDVNCWEVEGNRCSEHGKSCATCFVRTELQQRAELKLKA